MSSAVMSGPRTPAPAPRKSLKKIKDSVEYYPHQIEAVRELDKWTNFILADVMGLGKTLTAVTVAALDFERGTVDRMLVVTLASLKQNFADDLDRHTNFTWEILEGTRSQRTKQMAAFNKDVLITNYEQVVAHWEELNEMNFGIVIYDEAHAFKSKRSARTKAVHKLKVGRHFALSGSIILNQVDDLWAILHRIDPEAFPQYWRFINRYAVFGGFQDKQIVGVKNELELREKLASRMMRREEDVIGRVPVKPIVEKVDLTPLQRQLYDQMRDQMLVDAPDAEDGVLIAQTAMTKMLRLQQIVGTTATIPGQPDESGKLDRAVAMCEEFIQNGHSVVVFTKFRAVQAAFQKRLASAGISNYMLHGDVPPEDRVPLIREWTQETEAGRPGVMICMFQVGGVGLNMTCASKMILLDKDFAPEINKQAIARIDRIGQTKPVMVWELQARNSIDSRLNKINENKSLIFKALVANQGTTAWQNKVMQVLLADESEANDLILDAVEDGLGLLP